MINPTFSDQLYNMLYHRHQATEELEEDLGVLNEEYEEVLRPWNHTHGYYEPYEHDYSKFPETFKKYEKNFKKYEEYRDYFKVNQTEYPRFIDHEKAYHEDTINYTDARKY